MKMTCLGNSPENDLFAWSEENPTVENLVRAGALFVVNHSGGKDSQAMLIKVRKEVPEDQILIIHATLPEVDWEGTSEKVEEYAGNIPVIYAQAYKKDGTERTFFNMVEDGAIRIAKSGKDASPWPSPKYRQCTSDLKRGPLNREMRRWADANGFKGKAIVSCEGMRAEESSPRAGLKTFKKEDGLSNGRRDWFKWLPIHKMLETEVFQSIKAAEQEPHWAYAAGMSRLSCCFCIMSNKKDLKTARQLKPELFQRYLELENKLGKSMMMPKKGQDAQYLDDFIGE